MKWFKRWAASALLLIGVGSSSPASAALIDFADFTRETTAGLDWLHMDQTLSMTWNQVNAALQAGQALEGWRFASQSEVEGFWTAVFAGWEYGWSENNTDMVDAVAAHLGYTTVLSDSRHAVEAMGMLVSGASTRLHVVLNWAQPAGDPDTVDLVELSVNGLATATEIHGRAVASYLVRASVVPEPGTIVLLSLALAGCGRVRRRSAHEAQATRDSSGSPLHPAPMD